MNKPEHFSETVSVAGAATLLGVERTTIYRLIWDEKLRVCSGFKQNRISRVEIERFLRATATYRKARHERAPTRSDFRQELTRPPLQPHVSSVEIKSSAQPTVFIPKRLLRDSDVAGRLVRTVVYDDDARAPENFVAFKMDINSFHIIQ